MIFDNEYLTDDELDMLIDEVEENEMVIAPPDMLECILAKVEEAENVETSGREDKQLDGEISEIKRPPEDAEATKTNQSERIATGHKARVIEFRRYCMKVVAGAAAAIIILCLLPAALYKREAHLQTPSKSEVLEEQDKRIEKNEDDEKGIVNKIKGQNRIFGHDYDLGIFDDSEE